MGIGGISFWRHLGLEIRGIYGFKIEEDRMNYVPGYEMQTAADQFGAIFSDDCGIVE